MKPYLFVFAVWPAALCAMLLALSDPRNGQTQTGQIVLERAPFCDFFVVKSGTYYVFMTDRGGWVVALASGNVVSGRLLSIGDQEVSVDGRARLNVHIRGWEADWRSAVRRFDAECDPNATNPFGSGAAPQPTPVMG